MRQAFIHGWFTLIDCVKFQPESRIIVMMKYTVEFYGNSLTQTNQIKQTKQKFIRLYYLDCWIEIIQCDEENKSSTKCIVVQIIQFDELLFCLICLG